jgi:hypothetical protein
MRRREFISGNEIGLKNHPAEGGLGNEGHIRLAFLMASLDLVAQRKQPDSRGRPLFVGRGYRLAARLA